MTSMTMTTATTRTYDETVALVRRHLPDVGFGVLTEIDMQATLKAKLGVDVEPQIILGACRPELAHAATQADPSVAALLPCNVVVRAHGDETIVETLDPRVMTTMAPGGAALQDVAEDARRRLTELLRLVGNA
ncbi:DUF302 domain-containing protein [Aeromicrobium sp. CFBP 8757]|uniref:DUF302 domain-containing protein n=1 Tax=Aeromicrobium sp. CFBP 8757 TaxID=2775288 RepID=UPI00177B2E71|nr:DUF302 domain-containing protein [Aeromicrobium sp. CFBP 8757]MBD8606958.1 DUF302 domain-containing protein [Aeromicrobium sp. CFBP 8757]